jgi:hypothetical protein
MLNISFAHESVKFRALLIDMRTASLAFWVGASSQFLPFEPGTSPCTLSGVVYFSILAKKLGILFNPFEFAVTNSILHTKA